jgi:hypothetical protein
MTEDQRSEPSEDCPPDCPPIGRRMLLAMLGVGVAGLATAPYPQRGWDSVRAEASADDPTGHRSAAQSGPLLQHRRFGAAQGEYVTT